MKKHNTTPEGVRFLISMNDFDEVSGGNCVVCGDEATYSFKLTNEPFCTKHMLQQKQIVLEYDSELYHKALSLVPARSYMTSYASQKDRRKEKVFQLIATSKAAEAMEVAGSLGKLKEYHEMFMKLTKEEQAAYKGGNQS